MVASNAFDYYYQTLENVRFFSPQNADVSIVTAKEPLGTFKALVMRTEGKTRTALLSVSANSMPDALRLLHHKSAEAVHNHMTTYGCDIVRDIKKRSKKKLDVDSSDTDIVDDDVASSSDSSEGSSVSGFTFSKPPRTGSQPDVDEQHSDSSDDERTSRKHHRRSGRTKTRGREASVRSCSSSVCVDDDVIDTCVPPAMPQFDPVPDVVPTKPLPTVGPMGRMPPPGWPTMPRYNKPSNGANVPTPPSSDVSPFSKFCPPHPAPTSWMPRRCPPVMPPPATPEQVAPPSRDVKLHLIWPSYGDVRVIEHCKPSRRILEAVAVRCVTEQKASFGLDATFFATTSIKATLRHVQLGNERYSLSSFNGEDLTSLFNSAGGDNGGGIPLFEIEIERVPPLPIGRPWGLPRPMGGTIEIVSIEGPSKTKGKRGQKAGD